MAYILENKGEAQRLDQQSENKCFSLAEELAQVALFRGQKVLDAGCGSGVLLRELVKKGVELNLSGCDISQDRIDYCKQSLPNANFYKHDIVEKPVGDQYDLVFNRYVAHHLGEEKYFKALKNLKQSLKPKGKLFIIDAEGIIMNVGTTHKELLEMLETFKRGFEGDLYLARKIPFLLKEAGFSNVGYDIQIMNFQGTERESEVLQWKERMNFSLETYSKIFGNELRAQKFINLYLNEIKKDHVPLYYVKFLIQASA